MRQFRLINGNGETFDLMRKDAFFHAPGGLGFDREIESMMAGYEFVELRDDLAQKQITGEMVFLGYEQYKEFIAFIGVKPLRLEYKPLNQWHRIRVKVQRIGKTEISRVGRLICAIDFLAFSTWYNVLNYETVPEEEPEYENLMVRGNAIHIVEDDDDSYTIGASTDADDVVKRFLSGDLATTENTVPVQLPGFAGDTYQLTAGDYFFKAIGKRQGVRSYFKVKPLVKTASGNPIQISDAIEVAPNSLEVSVSPKQDGTPWIGSETDTDPYTFRSMPSGASGGNREYDKLVGGSVVWNQLVENGDFADSTGWSVQNTGSNLTIADGVATWTTTKTNDYGERIQRNFVSTVGHKYLFACEAKVVPVNNVASVVFVPALFRDSAYVGNGSQTIPTNAWTSVMSYVTAITNPSNRVAFSLGRLSTTDVGIGSTVSVRKCMLIDLTAMFGTSVANSMTAELFRSYFPKAYYAYTATPKIESVSVSEKVTTGKNLFDEDTAYSSFKTGTNAFTGTAGGVHAVNNYIPVGLVGKEITASVKYTAIASTSAYVQANVNGTNINGNSRSSGNLGVSSVTFTPTSTSDFFSLTFGSGASKNISFCDIQVEIGSTATTYEAYTSNTYSLSTTELRGIPSLVDGKLVYDGDEYASSGTVTRKYGVVDLGSLTWAIQSGYTDVFYATVPCIKSATRNTVCKYTKIDSGLLADKEYLISGTTVYIKDSNYSSASDFKTGVSGVLLVFELETANTYSQAVLSNLTWNVGSSYPHTFYAKLNGAKKYPINTTPSIVTTTSKYTIVGTRGTASYSDLQMSQGVNDDYIYIRDDSIADTSALVTSLSGEYLFYQLESTSTKESTTPFTNPQVIDEHGTESYTDYPMSQGTRDVAIPVGHKSNFALSVPVVGTDEVSVDVTGGNLVDFDSLTDGYYNANGVLISSTSYKITDYIPINSVVLITGYVESGNIYSCWFDNNKARVGSVFALSSEGNRLLPPTGAVYLRCSLNSQTISSGQFVVSTGESYTHSMSTMYGGTVEMVSGVETTEMAEVDLSTLSWNYSANRNGYFYTLLAGMKPNETLYCNAYPFIGIRPSTYSTDKVLALENASDLYIDIHDTSYDNATDFSASLSGVKLVYQLATPTTASGTPDGVTLLKGTNVISTDGDDIDLNYDAYPDSRLVLDVYGELAPDPDSAADTQIVSNFTVYDDQEVQFYMDQEDIPFDYSVEAFLAAGSYPANKVYGYPYPYSYSGSVNGEMDVFNGSTVAGYCRLTIQGPVEDPIWAVYQNGQLLQRGKITATIPEGHVLVVDSSPTELEISERTLDGELVANRYADSDFSTVRFITIPPGSSKVVVTQTGDEPITAYLEVDELEATV